MAKFKVGDHVIALRLSENLGGAGKVGEVYRIWAISPKVRVTPGTGDDFLNVEDARGKRFDAAGNNYAFNFSDVKKVERVTARGRYRAHGRY